jgi:hypothetical protein
MTKQIFLQKSGNHNCSIPKIQILKFSQTRSKFKMNFKFHFKMFVCELISTNKIYWSIFSPKSSLKYPTNVFPVIPLKFFPEILPRYFPSDHPQIFPEILPKYSIDISPSIFTLEKYLQNHFSSPYKYFLHNFPHAHTYTYASGVIR